jgi:hypothetical protein
MSGDVRLLPPHDFKAYTEAAKGLSDSQKCDDSHPVHNAPRCGGVFQETTVKFVVACQLIFPV